MRSSRIGAWGAAVAAVILFLPALYQVSVSLMAPEEAVAHPPVLVPADPRFGTYVTAWRDLGLAGLLGTTVILAVLAAAFQVLTGSAAAFALARLRFPGRRWAVATLPVVAAVPALALLVPRFVVFDAWGWTGGFTALVAPALVSTGCILFLYEVFRGLPREPEEAARMDGAGEWAVFSRVVVPQARPALAIVAGAAILAQWRGLLWPLMVTGRTGPDVVELGLARRVMDGGGGAAPALLAAGVVVALPALATALWISSMRARPSGASGAGPERQGPVEVSPLTAGPFEHHIL